MHSGRNLCPRHIGRQAPPHPNNWQAAAHAAPASVWLLPCCLQSNHTLQHLVYSLLLLLVVLLLLLLLLAFVFALCYCVASSSAGGLGKCLAYAIPGTHRTG